MEEYKVITVDLTGCKYLGELHQRIREAFDFPEWYGENWDAFWDLLHTECDVNKVIIKGEHTMPEEFGNQLSRMHKILNKMVEHCKRLYDVEDQFEYEIID